METTLENDNILWSVELERGQELIIEVTYFDDSKRIGRVRYRGPIKQPIFGVNSNEYVTIPEFEAIGPSNPLTAGHAKKYRIL